MKLLRRKRRSKPAATSPQPLAGPVLQSEREPVEIEELSDRHLAQARGGTQNIGPGEGSGGNGVPPP